MQEAKKAINKANQRKSQCEDGLQNPPQLSESLVMTRSIWRYFSVVYRNDDQDQSSQQISIWQEIRNKPPHFTKVCW